MCESVCSLASFSTDMNIKGEAYNRLFPLTGFSDSRLQGFSEARRLSLAAVVFFSLPINPCVSLGWRREEVDISVRFLQQ